MNRKGDKNKFAKLWDVEQYLNDAQIEYADPEVEDKIICFIEKYVKGII